MAHAATTATNLPGQRSERAPGRAARARDSARPPVSRAPRRAHDAHIGSTVWGEQRVMLARPLTFMNLSGRAVSALLRYHNVQPHQLLIICDDLNLPLGRLRLRRGGSDGGHNGLKSISQALSTNEYPRLRFGV